MELKQIRVWHARGNIYKFQLHLYGIETQKKRYLNIKETSSNCTFMELKLCLILCLKVSDLFQLHLYGIETELTTDS